MRKFYGYGGIKELFRSFIIFCVIIMACVVFLNGPPPIQAQDTGNRTILVTHDNTLLEFKLDGTQVSSLPIPYGNGDYPVTEKARDLVLMKEGDVAIYNGTLDPDLSVFDTQSGEWHHDTHPGWSTVNNVSYGGIAKYQEYIYVTDMGTSGDGGADEAKGIVRFDLVNGTSERFADNFAFNDLTMGHDGLLYGLAYDSEIKVYDPVTMTEESTIALAEDVRAIAVNSAGDIFAPAWDGTIYHFDNFGAIQNSTISGANNLIDVDLTEDGQLVLGSRFGYVYATDESLESVNSFEVGYYPVFVAFKEPQPASYNLLVSTTNNLSEYTFQGDQVWSESIPYPGGTRPSTELARDIIPMASGIAVYNGTFDPYLSVLDRQSGAWSHDTHEGWSTVNNVSYGGIAKSKDFVYVTDMRTSGDGGADYAKGIVRFDLIDGTSERFVDTIEFIDLTMGHDGLLYGLTYSRILKGYDPVSMIEFSTVSLPSDTRAIAVNSLGHIFAATWSGTIYRYDSDGFEQASLPSGTNNLCDIDLSKDARLAVGSRFGDIVMTDESLDTIHEMFTVSSNPVFVSFVEATQGGTDPGLLSGLLLSRQCPRSEQFYIVGRRHVQQALDPYSRSGRPPPARCTRNRLVLPLYGKRF